MGVLTSGSRGVARGALALGLAAAACQNPAAPEPLLEDHHVVFSVLRVGSATAEVVLERWPSVGGYDFVTGATVSLTGLGATTQLVESPVSLCHMPFEGDPAPGRVGCYTATLPQPVAPLETYELEVVLPNGDVVTGVATTPALPDFRTTPDTVVAVFAATPDNLPVAVAPTEVVDAPGAMRIDVAFSVAAGAPDPECVPDAHVDPYRSPALLETHDFYFWRLVCEGQTSEWSVLDLRLHAAAYDASYAAYLGTALEGNAFSGEDGTFGLTGAVGVFGAAAVTTVPLVLAFRPAG